jgi:hypothetical protein
MFSILTQEFHSSLPLDNGLLVDDIKNGVAISERDIVDVMVNARALFTLTTWTCRELVRVGDCLKLWTETAKLISRLCASWAQVEADDHPRVGWLLTELRRLQALCEDRCELYCVSAADRRHYTEVRKDIDFEYSFSNGMADGSRRANTSPAAQRTSIESAISDARFYDCRYDCHGFNYARSA